MYFAVVPENGELNIRIKCRPYLAKHILHVLGVERSYSVVIEHLASRCADHGADHDFWVERIARNLPDRLPSRRPVIANIMIYVEKAFIGMKNLVSFSLQSIKSLL